VWRDVTVWLDGKVVDPDEAQVSVFDRGLTVGDGVFETVKVVAGVPFALTRHLDRLAQSAARVGLPTPEMDAMRAAVAELLAAAAPVPRSARLRMTYTGGVSQLGSERGTAQPTLIVVLAPLPDRPPTVSAVTVPWPRNDQGALAGVKTTSYAENVLALGRANALGAGEAFMPNTRGNLCEGTGSNVFVAFGDRLVTPPRSSGCLAGVTRALVLEWVGGEEADVPMSALSNADEIFITSATRDVRPVHALDGRSLPAPGPATKRVMEVYAERSAAHADP
jgi:branched-chain amino acid aminotransferase